MRAAGPGVAPLLCRCRRPRGPSERQRGRKPVGRANRQAIATRQARLRAAEHAYRTTLDHDEALTATQHARALRVADHLPDREMEPD